MVRDFVTARDRFGQPIDPEVTRQRLAERDARAAEQQQKSGSMTRRYSLGKREPASAVLRQTAVGDAREAADTRTPAQRWLNDPPPGRSALAQRTAK